jgi:uncharacterized protein YwbE
MEVIVGDTFVDPGATANDTLDGDVSSKITSSVQSVTTYTQPSYFSYATSNSSTTVWSFKKDSSNNYITNSYSELMKYNSSGGNIFSIPKLSAPQGIVTDSYGNIFVEGQNSQNIIKINSSGTSTLFGSLTAQPIAIAIDSSDNLYVLDYSGNLKKWNAGPPGSGPSGSASTIATGICLPLSMYNIAGLAVDSSGNAYVPCTDNTVTKITSGGVKSTLGSASGTYPQGIVADGSGNIYTANYSSNNVTKRTQGGVTTILGTTGTHPKGITLDSYGNVYTVNDTNITKITTGGTSTTFGGAASSMLNQASIKVDSFGNIYVPQANSTYTVNTIFKVTQSGATSTFANTGVNPVFLAMDSAENLYVSNYLSSTITKVAISYATSTFATTGYLP